MSKERREGKQGGDYNEDGFAQGSQFLCAELRDLECRLALTSGWSFSAGVSAAASHQKVANSDHDDENGDDGHPIKIHGCSCSCVGLIELSAYLLNSNFSS